MNLVPVASFDVDTLSLLCSWPHAHSVILVGNAPPALLLYFLFLFFFLVVLRMHIKTFQVKSFVAP
jgi:hypothetical protein